MTDEPKDEFEDEMIKQLMELFSSMNLPMDEQMFSKGGHMVPKHLRTL